MKDWVEISITEEGGGGITSSEGPRGLGFDALC